MSSSPMIRVRFSPTIVTSSAGRFISSRGQQVCDLCPAGEYQNNSQQTSCSKCPIGSATALTGSKACIQCSPGRYTAVEGLSVCLDCQAGTFASSPGLANCTQCVAGQYQDEAARSACRDCAAGRYLPLAGQSNCLSCAPGSFTNQSGQTNCTQCPAGYFQKTESQLSCDICGPGSFSTLGSAACIDCGDKSVTQKFGTPDKCVACPDFSSANVLRTECLCDVGYYLLEYVGGDINNFKCVECPVGANCDNAGVRWDTMVAAEGFWRANNVTTSFFRCLFRDFCVGGASQSGASACQNNREGPLCALCVKGYYTGAAGLCLSCPQDSGGSLVFLAGMCALMALFLWLMFYVILKAGAHLLEQVHAAEDRFNGQDEDHFADDDEMPPLPEFDQAQEATRKENAINLQDVAAFYKESDNAPNIIRSSSDANMGENYDDVLAFEQGNEENWEDDYVEEDNISQTSAPDAFHAQRHIFESAAFLEPHNREIMTIYGPPLPVPNFTYKMKIAVSFMQIISNVSAGLEVRWPQRYKNFIVWLEVVNFDFLISQASSAECVEGYSFYSKYLVVIVLPLLVFTVITVFYILPRLLRCCWWSNISATELLRSKMNYWKMVCFLFFLIYPGVSSVVMRLFVCKEIEGERFLVADLSEKCGSDTWNSFLMISIPAILLYPVGIPAFFWNILWKHHRTLTHPHTKAQIGFLYAGYRLDVWWFEMCDLLHKLTLTSLVVFAPESWQLPVAMVVAVLYMNLLMRVNPYVRDDDDRLHLFAQVEITLLIMAGNVFYNLPPKTKFTELEDWVISLALITMTLGFFALFVWEGWVVARRVYGLYRREKEEEEEHIRKTNEELQSKTQNLGSTNAVLEAEVDGGDVEMAAYPNEHNNGGNSNDGENDYVFEDEGDMAYTMPEDDDENGYDDEDLFQ